MRARSDNLTDQQIFVGNNLGISQGQSFLELVAQTAVPGAAHEPAAHRRPVLVPNTLTGGGVIDPDRFYSTTSSSAYGSFAQLPALPRSMHALREPLFQGGFSIARHM